MSRPEPSIPGRERAGTDRPRGLLLPLIAIAGFFATIMFAASAQGLPQFGGWFTATEDRAGDDVLPTAPTETAPPPLDPPEDSPLLAIIGYVLAAVVVAVVLAMVYLGLRLLIRYLVGLWRDRPLARREAARVDARVVIAPAAHVEPDEATIQRGIAEALRTIDGRTLPGDSIVAAWVGLEESAADAGAGRGVNETPSEFTVRIIGRRAGIADDVVALLGLYEQVRFGGHDADERDRARAADCLRGIQKGWR
ncbi:DUF4129 domain-containing protein [Microbacterium sp. STF-2]|uniref:DUF4129 domain-containing protein n=1 Tax=Microbacterium sp. STF-2 TaxID=3031132 RepID=UPI002AFFC079|nr:DUF4129 domain-containing protein [Microbacterium sp. STF-2]MEA1261534.1 DUF4129 domain-containing protein [Microbacterium sp. STF-2]